MSASPHIPVEIIAEFCRKWRIAEFSLFGSVIRGDLKPESDVDVLVAFEPGRTASLEEWLDMEDELRALFGRRVDLVERRRLTNPFRRHEILTNRRVI